MMCTRLLGAIVLGTATWLASASLQAQTVPEIGPLSTLVVDEMPSQRVKPVISGLALDPHGRYLAAAGDDHVVRIWNAADGTLLHRLEGHTGWVRACEFSPDGQLLATAGQDRQIYLWDPATGRQVRQLPPVPAAVGAIAFSPDGQILAAGGFENRFRLFDVPSGQVIQTVEAGQRDVRALAFSADGQLLAAAGTGGQIRIVALNGGVAARDRDGKRRRAGNRAGGPLHCGGEPGLSTPTACRSPPRGRCG